MNSEEARRDRLNHPSKYARGIKITYRQVGPNKWEEAHDGTVVGLVREVPFYAKPAQAESPDDREIRKSNESWDAYEKRRNDPAFTQYREKLREKAESLPPEEAELLDTDHAAFVAAYDAEKLSDLDKAHAARIDAITGRQFARGHTLDKSQADVDAIAAVEEYHAERDKIRSGNYEND